MMSTEYIRMHLQKNARGCYVKVNLVLCSKTHTDKSCMSKIPNDVFLKRKKIMKKVIERVEDLIF